MVKDNQVTDPHARDSRRGFLKTSGRAIAAGSAISTLAVAPKVHAAGSDVLRLGLVGCGGRGTGAAVQALTADPNTQLFAVADAFAEPIYACLQSLAKQARIAEQVNVDEERRFGGFDGFKQLLDSDVDVVMLCTPPHFRPMHLRSGIGSRQACIRRETRCRGRARCPFSTRVD